MIFLGVSCSNCNAECGGCELAQVACFLLGLEILFVERRELFVLNKQENMSEDTCCLLPFLFFSRLIY